MHLGFQTHARLAAHVEGAHALGAVGLVGGHAHQVDGQHVHVNLDAACGLRCIHMQQDALFAAEGADRRNVLDHTDFVVHEEDADQDGVRADGSLQGVHAHQAIFLHIQVSHFKTLAFQFTHGVQNSLVFCLERDQVLALAFVELGSALQGQIDRFSSATGPHDFTGIGTDQVGHLGARLLDGLFRFPAPGVAAGSGVAKVLAQPGDHRVHHARVHGGGGAVVEINRKVWGHVDGWLSCVSGWQQKRLSKTGKRTGRCRPLRPSASHGCQDLANALPSANTEFGAFTRIGLTTGVVEIARRTIGLSSICTPLASCSSTSFCSVTESRNSTMR